MLETVEIKNFQGHEHTILEFDKGVNVIKGPSHSGKSSIWRALRWALQNRPLGEAFKSYSATKEDEVSVALEFDNGVLIRKRTKKDNIYEVNTTELKAIKSDIPTEVTDLTQLSEVNLHGQDDPYFLLLDSPGDVARKLNETVGLDIIDGSMSKINGIVSKANIALKIINEDISKAENDLESLYWLEEVGPKITKIDNGIKESELLKNRIYHLNKKMEDIRAVEDTIKEYEYWIGAEKYYSDLNIKFRKREELSVKISKIGYYLAQINDYTIRIKQDEDWLSVEGRYIKLSQKVIQRQQLLDKIRQLKAVCKRISDVEIVVNSANKDVQNLQTKYNALLKSTGVCPLCKRAW